MRYSVMWTPSARAQLANLWMQSPDRQAITDSADRIDRQLQNDADTKGINWWPFRAYFNDPLAVLFTVDPGDCRVWVVQVRTTS